MTMADVARLLEMGLTWSEVMCALQHEEEPPLWTAC